jgi:hypothetical protein
MKCGPYFILCAGCKLNAVILRTKTMVSPEEEANMPTMQQQILTIQN